MKKILCILLCIFTLLSFAACQSESELKQEQNWEEAGQKVMTEFLKNKYSIDVELTNVNVCVDRNSGFVPVDSAPLIPYVTAKFDYDDKTYCVCANLTDENNPICYDDFQQEEVTRILVDYINQLVGAEAIAWYNRTFDVFEERYHVEDNLNKSEARLLNKKITTIDDLVANSKNTSEQKQYTLTDITVYYHNADPFNFSDEAVQKLKKMYDVTIVNLSETKTAYEYHGRAAGIALFKDEIIECVSFGYQVEN